MTTRFYARKTHKSESETHYTIFMDGYQYSIGNLKQQADGQWLTYCGGFRPTGFHEALVDTGVYPTAAEALAAFRSRFEAQEAVAAELRSRAFAAIAGHIPPVERDPRLTQEQFDDITVSVRLIRVYADLSSESISASNADPAIEFECTVPEAFAFLECPNTNVEILLGYRTWTFKGESKRHHFFTEWFIPALGKDYHLRGIGQSLSGRGRQSYGLTND